MAAPIRRHVRVRREAMWDSVIDFLLVSFLFVSISLGRYSQMQTHAIGIRLGDTLRDHFRITFLVTGVSTIFALVSFAREEELLTQSTHDRLVELALDKLMTVHLEYIALSFSNGSLST